MNNSFQMRLFDLKLFLPIGHNSATPRKEMDYRERRQNRFFSNHGVRSIVPVSPMRRSLQRQLQGVNVYLPGSVSLHGLRTAYISRKSSGHRSMSSRREAETLSHGYPEQRLPKHVGQCQREPRLENLRGLCPSADQNRQRTIRKRRLRSGIEARCLRLRFNDYRSLPFSISLGKVSQKKSCGEASHPAGSSRQHPRCDQHYQWENTRCQRARRSSLRAWSHLCFRQGICRFRPSLPDSPITCVLRNAREEQFCFQAPLLSAGGQVNRGTSRPNHYGNRLLYTDGLSREAQENPLLRCRDKETFHLSDQQLRATSNRDRKTLQMPLAGGAILQMDQTAPADQGVLRHQRKRSEDSNLDRHLRVRSRGHCQETIEAGSKPLHNSTNIECDHVRENAHFAGAFCTDLRKRYH